MVVCGSISPGHVFSEVLGNSTILSKVFASSHKPLRLYQPLHMTRFFSECFVESLPLGATGFFLGTHAFRSNYRMLRAGNTISPLCSSLILKLDNEQVPRSVYDRYLASNPKKLHHEAISSDSEYSAALHCHGLSRD